MRDAAGPRPGQLRLRRRRPARGRPLHRGQADRRSPSACWPSCGSSTVDMRPNYDGTTRGAGRPAGPVPEPARQRRRPASPSAWRPTSRRTTSAKCCEACVHLIDEPGRDHRPAARQASRARTSRSAARSSPTGRRCARSTRKAAAASRCRASGRSRRPARSEQIVITSIPYGVDKGNARKRHRRDHRRRGSCRSCVGLTNESNEKEGLRIALEMKPDADPEPGDGLPLQAHRAAGELRRTT